MKKKIPETEIGVDNLFHSETARIDFKTFRKFDSEESREESVLSLISFDAVITEDVDSFESSSEETALIYNKDSDDAD